jgi:hypothetical protein
VIADIVDNSILVLHDSTRRNEKNETRIDGRLIDVTTTTTTTRGKVLHGALANKQKLIKLIVLVCPSFLWLFFVQGRVDVYHKQNNRHKNKTRSAHRFGRSIDPN